MDGRLIIEDGTILDLLEMIVGANRGRTGKAARRSARARQTAEASVLAATTARSRAQRRAPLRPQATSSTNSSSTTTSNTAAPTSPIPKNSLEQAQLDKKAHIAAKLALEARAAGARHRLRLGRHGAVPAQGRRGRCAWSDAVGAAAEDRPPARRGGRRLRPCEVRADRLSPAREALRPDRLGRHVRACRRASITTNSSPSAASC